MKRSATKFAAIIGGLFVAMALFAAPTQADDVTPQVVGGTPAAQGEFPWVVHLSMGCGGSFIRQDIILTAAHCVSGTGNNTSIRVEYGNVNLGSGTTVNSKYVFDNGSIGNDWALIQLQSKVAGAALLPLGNTSHETGNFTIMGWGATSEGGSGSNRLLKATVPFVPDTTCDDYYGTRLNKTTEICAGFPGGGTDTCQGDSGGPMVKNTGSGYVQVGIVSWGDGCARPNAYGIYTQVSHFASAINAKADELSGGTPPSGCSRTNGTDFAINDNSTITSTIAVSGCTGNASASASVAVNIVHTYIGDLKVDLIAPDGSVYVLHNRSGGSADNINRSYTVNLSSEPRNGTWSLRVNDNANADTGRLDTWTVNL